jgi:hypothetical protein
MARAVSVDFNSLILVDSDGKEHSISPREYWYLAPARTTWTAADGAISPLSFATTLHNAKIGHGICPALTDLLEGLSLRSLKRAAPLRAEQLFETVRSQHYPHRPTRLRSHFLSFDKATAERRAIEWGWQSRRMVRCHLILSSGVYHCADLRHYEQCALGLHDETLAHDYWKGPPSDLPVDTLEIIADSALYFPDWDTFDEIDFAGAGAWNAFQAAQKPNA